MKQTTDKEKATVRQKAPTQNPNMKTDTQTDDLLSQYSQDCEVLRGQVKYAEQWRDHHKAQADKLAEALRDVTTAAEIVDGSEHPDDSDIDHMLECFRKSHEALAEYESEVQP
jgi:hypothetical protein